jgi:hypothetical protein
MLAILVLACVAAGSGTAQTPAPTMPPAYQQVLDYLLRKGDFAVNVLKVNVPRTDLQISVAGVATPTPFGFGGWIAMTRGEGGHEVMMGDLVLLQSEVNPVMSALLDNGIEVTALHNHFFWVQPEVFYMHVHAHGDALDLAHRVKPALDLIGKAPAGVVTTAAAAPGAPLTGNLDSAALARIVGHAGDQTGAVYKITIGRDDLAVKDVGATINARMGLNTWAAFYGSDQEAVIAGDFAMLESELTPVLKTLRGNGLDVVAIHHHMTGVQPMIIFLHYWGRGRAETLARAFRAGLDQLGKSTQK